MITVVQRVERAAVAVAGVVVGAIERGLLLLLAIEHADTEVDAAVTARKIASLRCFPGASPMDRSVADIQGGCLVVSQFTLAAELASGNRPSFVAAAAPAHANVLYQRVAEHLAALGVRTATGSFGAAMAVDLLNDGPVTFILTVRNGRVVARE